MLQNSLVSFSAIEAELTPQSDPNEGASATGTQISLGSSVNVSAANSDSLVEREEPELCDVARFGMESAAPGCALPALMAHDNSSASLMTVVLPGVKKFSGISPQQVPTAELATPLGNPPAGHGAAMSPLWKPGVLESWNPAHEPVIGIAEKAPPLATKRPHHLERFSLTGQTCALEEMAGAEIHILGSIALKGQATVIYAAPNTGKTLLVLHLIIEGIKAGKIEASKLFYINVDDDTRGLAAKNNLADEYGFHMLADGYNRFKSRYFLTEMQTMIDGKRVDGAVVVLDTLKRFVNTMDKNQCREFSGVVRQFVLGGGTVIALAHTNKKPGADGKGVFSGTSDMVDDFDCVYMLDEIPSSETDTKYVEFVNKKRRGSVIQQVAYCYATGTLPNYTDLILSVAEVSLIDIGMFRREAEVVEDGSLITAITSAISGGEITKMKLIEHVSKTTNASKRAVGAILERYSGTDPNLHRWNFAKGPRGANMFRLHGTTVQ